VSLNPEAFGKFILLDKLAMGGMAEVYRAKSFGAEGIGKIIAIKRILPQYTTNHEFIEMFKEEAKIAVNLTHANIVPIYEFGEEQSQFFLVMDYVDGRNLRQILSRCSKLQKSLTIEQCVYVMAQVATGLDYAHRCTDKNTGKPLSIIHRDMSPQNIMISFEGEVKIVDFGIAKAETKIETTRAGTLKGKFGYMSPEQAEGQELDARTDIFSAGIVLWELLSGERLFVANNEMNTIRKIRDCQVPSLRKMNPNIHEELDRITQKTLAKDRALRYQTAAELYKDLSRFLYKINPEFTPQELTSFVKSLFKEEIVEDRKLVAEFAKVKAPIKSDERTMVISEQTHTQTSTSTSTDGVPQNLLDEASLKKDIDLSVKVDRVDLLRKANSAQNQPRSTSSGHSGIRPLGAPPQSAGTQTGYTMSRSNIRRAPSSGNWGMIVFILLALIGGAYYFGPQLGLGKVLEKAHLSSLAGRFGKTASNESNQEAGNTDVTNSAGKPGSMTFPKPADVQPKVRVFLSTQPVSEILVDGEKVGQTPMEVQLPYQKPVTITFRREGYLNIHHRYIGTQLANVDSIQFPLPRPKKIGYVTISSQPSGATVFINGKQLPYKTPVAKEPVEAEKKVTIRAVNDFNKAESTTMVEVREWQNKDIALYPNKK